MSFHRASDAGRQVEGHWGPGSRRFRVEDSSRLKITVHGVAAKVDVRDSFGLAVLPRLRFAERKTERNPEKTCTLKNIPASSNFRKPRGKSNYIS